MDLTLESTVVGPAYLTTKGRQFLAIAGVSKVMRHCERSAELFVDKEAVDGASTSPFYEGIPGVALPTFRHGCDDYGLVYKLDFVTGEFPNQAFAVKLFMTSNHHEPMAHLHYARLLDLAKVNAAINPLVATRRVLFVLYDASKPELLDTHLLSRL